MTSIAEVVGQFDLSLEQRQQMEAALLHREDHIADRLRMAGVQFGLFPQIVAEVLADVGIGTPLPEAERNMVRQAYTQLMTEIEAAFREGRQPPQPPGPAGV